MSNYFHAKEDLALVGHEEIEQGLIRAIVQRGPGQSILTATRDNTVDAARQMASMPAKRREACSVWFDRRLRFITGCEPGPCATRMS